MRTLFPTYLGKEQKEPTFNTRPAGDVREWWQIDSTVHDDTLPRLYNAVSVFDFISPDPSYTRFWT